MWRSWEQVHETVEPVFWRDGHLVVAGPAEVRQVLADPDTYRPDNALDAVTPMSVAVMRVLAKYRFKLPATLANNGTDSHPMIRGAVFDAMHPARVEALRPWLTGIVRRRVAPLMRRLRAGESVDLHASLTTDLPLLVLARLIDLPVADVRRVKDFSAAALELFWAPLPLDRQLLLADKVGQYHRELREIARTGPGLARDLRGAGLTENEVTAALFFLLVAGQETTSQFLTLLLHRLAEEGLPDGYDTAAVVEEGLRLDPPIPTWRRLAAVPSTLAGVDVPAGTSVLLWLGAAGRAVAADPHAMVPGQRGSRRHLAFGAGAHRCVGAQLARMEAAVVLDEVAPLLRRSTVVTAPSFPANLSFRMPDTLVVRRADPARPADAA
ncbi:cytochrome P450 [Longispora urticae]